MKDDKSNWLLAVSYWLETLKINLPNRHFDGREKSFKPQNTQSSQREVLKE
jgi:hypothetical protein